jgi:Tfp pilus assembly protein PilX
VNTIRTHRHPRATRQRVQRGVVLLFSLISVVILLIAAIALMRSFQTSLFTAGNLGFKRDMRNQSEQVVSYVLTQFRTGTLDTLALRSSSNVAANYSATMLATDAEGIPTALQDANFATYGTAPDLTSPDGSVTLRYIIDRLCTSTGSEVSLGSSGCVVANNSVAPGGSVLNLQSAERQLTAGGLAAVTQAVVFRLTIRATGPRNTQSFFQSTFTVPS